jgi:hypothetical protein
MGGKNMEKKATIMPVNKIFAIAILAMLFFSFFIPLASATAKKAPENNGPWGFILSTDFEVSYIERVINFSGEVYWWGGPLVDLTVIGIGIHTIHYTCNYSVYTYGALVPQPQNGSFNGSDDLYLFNLHQKPIIKIKASLHDEVDFYLFKKGTWTGKFYIDGTLIETKEFSIEHL